MQKKTFEKIQYSLMTKNSQQTKNRSELLNLIKGNSGKAKNKKTLQLATYLILKD